MTETLLPETKVYSPRYGTTAEIAAALSEFSPDAEAAEIVVDILKRVAVIMNAGAAGGIAMAREDLNNVDPTAGRAHLNVDIAGTAAALIAIHLAAGDPHPQYITAGELAAALAPYLPSDADLVAIAGLATVAYGRSLLTLADKYALRASAGLKLGLGPYDLRPNWARHKSTGVADPHGILNLVAEDFIGDANGKPSFASFTRASAANYVNAVGLLATAAGGVLRHDYATDGQYLGWLIEGQRSNLALHSEATDNAAWTKINATIAANASVAPDGTLAADKIVEASDVAQSHDLTQAIVFTAATYCFSVYLKAAGRDAAMVQLDSTTPSNAFFDLVAGTVGDVGGALLSASITACGNGWYRCVVVGATAAATRNLRITPSIGTANGNETYNGNGSSGIHVWGAQVELGAFPSSYISTAGSQVTRPGDAISIATTAFPFNSSAGSLLVQFDVAALGLLSGIARLHNASFGGIALYRSTGNLIALDINDGTPRGNVAGSLPLVAGEPVRVAVAWKQGDGALCINGGAVATFAPSAIPAGLDTLELGGGGWGTGPLGGHLRHAAYFPRRLGNAELQDITRL